MDKLEVTGQNLGRVVNYQRGCVHTMQLHFFETKLPNLKLKTRSNKRTTSLTLDIGLPKYRHGFTTNFKPPIKIPFAVHFGHQLM
jgi:hypothetical protein